MRCKNTRAKKYGQVKYFKKAKVVAKATRNEAEKVVDKLCKPSKIYKIRKSIKRYGKNIEDEKCV